jgi:ribosomal protein S18 acetylase RimI-like enzyme
VVIDQRRRGIAKALMSTIIEKLKEDKDITTLRLEVNTDQDSAKRLYEHFDFKSLETIPLTLGDGVEHQVTKMEKHLSPNPSGVTKT